MNDWPVFNFKRPRKGPQRTLELLLRTLDAAREAKNKPRIIQIGANDGKLDDPLYPYFKENGWSGWLFEPHPIYFSDLRLTYDALPNVHLFNCGISNESKNVDLYHLKERSKGEYPLWLRGCASLERDRFMAALKMASARSDVDLDESYVAQTQVQMQRLDDVMVAEKITSIDAIVIDVEGHELSVLNSFSLSDLAPSVVILEANGGSKESDQGCVEKMKDAGLIVFRVGPELVGLRPNAVQIDFERVLNFLDFSQQ